MAFYDYFRTATGLDKQTQQLAGMLALSQAAGWWLPHQKTCWVSERHNTLNRDATGRLHCESGPAIEYPDGWRIFAIDGIRLDEQIVMRPQTQTIKQIDAEENGDIRAIRIDRYGWDNYLRDSKAKCVDFRDNDIQGTKEALYVTSKNETRLVATCATGRVFAMGVPPQTRTCVSAQEWLAGSKKFNIVGRT